MKNKAPGKFIIPSFYFLPFKFLLSHLRRLLLYLHAWWYGGHCEIEKSVRIKSSVLFQGEGVLILHDRVTLGYGLVGAPNLPIVLQPREADAVIDIGPRTAIMNGCELIALTSIVIGADCRIGPHTLIYDSDFHGLAPDKRNEPGKTAKVYVEDNVWVGSRSIILKGVTIEKDSVIAAGSVVTKNVSAGSVVAGNPARLVGSVYEEIRK
jgi:acetyltransferase-like isoleucine patch superfamily enzyme